MKQYWVDYNEQVGLAVFRIKLIAIQTDTRSEHHQNCSEKLSTKLWSICFQDILMTIVWILIVKCKLRKSLKKRSCASTVDEQSCGNWNFFIDTATALVVLTRLLKHFSEQWIFSQTAVRSMHHQCYSYICDCCSLRWIQRHAFHYPICKTSYCFWYALVVLCRVINSASKSD